MTGALFHLPREALLPALAAVNRAVAKRNTIPLLSNVLLSHDDGALTITGTDLDVEIKARVDAEGIAPFQAFTLPSALLHDAMRKLPDGADISFTGDPNGASMTIASGRARFRLAILPASDFPTISAGELSHRFSLSERTFAAIIATTAFAISTEETRYYLNGIHLHQDGEKLAAVATDGHRLALMRLSLPDGGAGMPPIILPRRTVLLLATLLGDKEAIDVALSDNKILFSLPGGVTITSKLVDGTYPDYQRVIPPANANRFKVSIEPLAKALDRVLTLSSDNGRACSFDFGDDALNLIVINPDQGEANDQVDIERIEGEPVKIGFNSRYCLDMLNAAGGAELIFELGAPGDPSRIIPAGQADGAATETMFVLMPMRI
ncbi:DNA polymerase III subunit beta [Phyllobacterium phragmitis]|uniref:Beta sliding clamp n=1 Tax=Phyllobacterium phragmitis TaxID=2670329 RepID=A0A2S9IPA8_9HYPH|nr:DNA polymerase III subunit beta [Phyllobacterium phragmitis]PRD42354.1 DNA polymerase III subunit beta [Phyllobacterium phragmitis]